MVEEYDYQAAQNNIEYEVLLEPEADVEGELLAIGKATLDDRKVERKIRIVEDEIQEAHDFYEGEELFHSDDWHRFTMGRLQSDGETIVVGEAPYVEKMPVEEWAEGYCINLLDDITEIWEEWYENIVEDA